MGNGCTKVCILKNGAIAPGTNPNVDKEAYDTRELEESLKPDLSMAECRMVASTWNMIKTDPTAKGLRVVDRMMSLPQILALFPTFQNKPQDERHQLPLYRQHASRIVQSVGAMVEEIAYLADRNEKAATDNRQKEAELQRGPMKMALLLYSLGQAHGRISGLTPKFFHDTCDSFITNALLDVWKDEIGPLWTLEIEMAWEKLFRFMTALLYRGIVYDSKLPRINSLLSEDEPDFNKQPEKVPWFGFLVNRKTKKNFDDVKKTEKVQSFPFHYNN